MGFISYGMGEFVDNSREILDSVHDLGLIVQICKKDQPMCVVIPSEMWEMIDWLRRKYRPYKVRGVIKVLKDE